MKKNNQGIFEIFTSKTDAINKLIQLQGFYHKKNSNNTRIEFTCNKEGRIIISNPQGHKENWCGKSKLMIKLVGKVIVQENKTFVTYYTTIGNFDIFRRLSVLAISIIICVCFGIFTADKIKALLATAVCMVAFLSQLILIIKEKENFDLNSNLLIEILEKKINDVNNWDR